MKDFAIAIHGGAENKSKEEIPEQKDAAYRQGLENALMAGWHILNKGGSAVEAVVAAVRSMENNSLFNAGKGAAFTTDRKIQFDAALMDGNTLEAGAVAGVSNIKNPILLAQTIMDKSEHVLLVGSGAEDFAREHELEFRPQAYFETEQQLKELEKTKREENIKVFDTVGAVALDKEGNLAAATSTGGLVNQLTGRVGDSPAIGSGTYANNEVCAVSCTGDGEGILRSSTAHEVYALMKYKQMDVNGAAREAMNMYKDKIEGDRNFVVMDPQGNFVHQFETNLMFRASRKNEEEPYVAIWKDE